MDVAAFLGRHPPFDTLDPGALQSIAESVRIEFFPVGSVIVQQGGEPAKFLYVIRRGAAELLDDGHVLDLLGEGEAFGHLSLLSGLGPTASIRASEDTICYLIEAGVAEEVLGTRRGLAFVSSTVRRQIIKVAEGVESGRADPQLVPAGSLIRRRPVTCDEALSIREAAELMTRERVSSLLVRRDSAWGILTDRDLLAKVLAGQRSPDAPVREVMTFPAVTVEPDTTAAEILSLMLEREFHHFPVVDEEGRLLGVLSDTDLMQLERHSPVGLKSAIQRARDETEVADAGRDLPRVVTRLVDAHADPIDVGHVVAVTIDALTRRLIELALADIGRPPVPWAWLALGSAARHEQALHSDQDHCLAYDPQDESADEVAPYFAELAKRVTSGLETAGIPLCNGGAMAQNPEFRRTAQGWVEAFTGWMHDLGIQGSIFSSIVFDYRRVTGPLDIESLLDPLIREAPRDPMFLRHLAKRALDRRPPTGFFRDLVVEGKGEHAGKLDVKHGGITLVTNLARVHSIAAGLTERRTVRRLQGAAVAGHIDEETRAGLEEAFRVLWRTRLEHQVACVRSGRKPDDFIDPKTLGPVSRRGLKEAFHIIAQAQKQLISHPMMFG